MKRAVRGQLVNRGKTVFLRFCSHLGLKRVGGRRGALGGQRNKKADVRSTVRRFFTGRTRRSIGSGSGGGLRWGGGVRFGLLANVCLIRLRLFLWERGEERGEKKRRKVTMHSEMEATQFGPTVTRVSNLQYESDEKSRDERKRRE